MSSKSSVAKDDFNKISVIGRGSYGKVYKVQHYLTKDFYAMKVVKKELVIKTDQMAGIKVEHEILRKFDHPFIMKM